jgi:uncharacterized protein YecT (DUF1311 family)
MPSQISVRVIICVGFILFGLQSFPVFAQDEPKPTAKQIAAVRACATKYQDDVDEGERQCIFLAAKPCTEKSEDLSTQAMANCYRVERMIWDDLLNEKFQNLLADLDGEQTAKLRAMQRAWIAYRDTTCGFYWDKIRGTIAIPMASACMARETGRRAMLLQFFSGL